MLVNLKRPPEAHQDRRRRGRLGLVLSRWWCSPSWRRSRPTGSCRRRAGAAAGDADGGSDNVEQIGMAALHRLPDSVRARVDAAARRDDRRDRAGEDGSCEAYDADYPDPLHGAVGGAVHHRRHRRDDAPQHHRHLHVDRADAERGEHQPGRVLAPAGRTRSARCSRSSSSASRRPRRPSAWASSSRSTGTRKRSTSTR